MVTKEMIRSPLFQQFCNQDFWHANYVNLVWRFNGQDVVEEADWLKDVWYDVRRRRAASAYTYVRPHNWSSIHEEECSVMLNLRFNNTAYALNFSVSSMASDKREWLAETLHRQIDRMVDDAYERGRQDVRAELLHTLGLSDVARKQDLR